MELKNSKIKQLVDVGCWKCAKEIQIALSFNSYFIEINFLISLIAKDIFAIPCNIRKGNFSPGGEVNHLPTNSRKLPKFFTKQSKRNEVIRWFNIGLHMK